MKRTWTDEQFTQAVKESVSWAEVLRKLNLKPGGGTQAYFRLLAKNLNLDTSHMRGQSWNRGGTNSNKRIKPIEDLLVRGTITQTHSFKLRLWKEGFFEKKCSRCGVEDWFGKWNHLQLDHIDGDRSNNTIENLRILCANCHSLTDTWTGKNRASVAQRQEANVSKTLQ